jgi:hypothetical protein
LKYKFSKVEYFEVANIPFKFWFPLITKLLEWLWSI